MKVLRLFLSLLIALWILAVCGNISTLFNVSYNVLHRSAYSVEFEAEFHSNVRTQASASTSWGSQPHQNHIRFDFGFAIIERIQGLLLLSHAHLAVVVNGMALTAICLIAALLWFQNDDKLTAKMVWLEIWLLIGKGLFQVFTIMPDPNPSRLVCRDIGFQYSGSWIFTRWNHDFCGDLLYSGHTMHVVFAWLLLDHVMIHTLGLNSNNNNRKIQLNNCKPTQLEYNRYLLYLQRSLSAVAFLIFISGLLILKLHYTIDIVVGGLLVVILFTHQRFLDLGVLWFHA